MSDKSGLKKVKLDDTIDPKKKQIVESEPVKKPEKVYKKLTKEEFKAIKQPITKVEHKIIYGRTHLVVISK